MTIAQKKKEREELLKLILERSNIKYDDFMLMIKHNFIVSNLDLLTESEKKRFNLTK